MDSSWTVGVDVGGSKIKGATVDLFNGRRFGRTQRDTPSDSTPDRIADVVAEVVDGRGGSGPVGVTLPGVVKDGVVARAANLHESWTGRDAVELFESRLGRPVIVLNDADAAGLAEIRFGAAREEDGRVLMLTFGTGIGSALFSQGVLVPNMEFGHMEVAGRITEDRASFAAMEREELSYREWSVQANLVLAAVEKVANPDLIILGGGISLFAAEWRTLIRTQARHEVAHLLNDGGIVGAAMVARTGLVRPGSRE